MTSVEECNAITSVDSDIIPSNQVRGTGKVLLLLSGGLDSLVAYHVMKAIGWSVEGIGFDYEQRSAKAEQDCINQIVHSSGMPFAGISFPYPGTSILTCDLMDLPKNRSPEVQANERLSPMFVPGRNMLMLAFAASRLMGIGAWDLCVGCNATDMAGFPDCQKDFFSSMEDTINLAMGEAIRDKSTIISLHTPLTNLVKAEVVELGILLGVDFSMSSSCYNPTMPYSVSEKKVIPVACGECDACMQRLAAFEANGIKDPIRYK